MSERDQSRPSDAADAAAPRGTARPGTSDPLSAAPSATSAVAPEIRGMDPSDRPGASGHRFGPDLACSECGIAWDVHQRTPAPCAKDAPADAFLRRPPVVP